MNQTIAAMRIARDLTALEGSLNEALAQVSALTHSIAKGRQLDGIAFSSGQESLVRLAAVQQFLTKSATETLRVHRDLKSTHERITSMPDSNGDCPELTSPAKGLRAA